MVAGDFTHKIYICIAMFFFYSYLLDWDGNEVNKGHFVDGALGAMWSGQYNRMLSIS